MKSMTDLSTGAYDTATRAVSTAFLAQPTAKRRVISSACAGSAAVRWMTCASSRRSCAGSRRSADFSASATAIAEHLSDAQLRLDQVSARRLLHESATRAELPASRLSFSWADDVKSCAPPSTCQPIFDPRETWGPVNPPSGPPRGGSTHSAAQGWDAPGDTHGVSENGYPGDPQRDGARGHEVERIERNPVGVSLQPMVQIVVSHRPCDHIGNQHRDRELPQQQPHNIARARTEYLADTDLFRTALSGECGNAE